MEWIEASEHEPQDREPMLVYFVNGLMMVAYWDERTKSGGSITTQRPYLVMELPSPHQKKLPVPF